MKYDYIRANNYVSPLTLTYESNWYYHTGGVRHLFEYGKCFAVFGLDPNSIHNIGAPKPSLYIPFLYADLRVLVFKDRERNHGQW